MTEHILCVGEILLRLSTPLGVHFNDASALNIHYGGAESNVAVNLSNLGYKTSFFSKLPESQLGIGVRNHLRRYGVDIDLVLGGGDRLGSYYLDHGAGERASTVIYDRARSSIAEMTLSEVDLDKVFEGKTMLHITGITPALSPEMREVSKVIIKEAKKRGLKVNFDVNYRSKLWSLEEASAFLKEMLPYVDYLSAAKLDAVNLLGISEVEEGVSDELNYYYEQIHEMFPNIQVIYSTIRNVISATHNTLQGTMWSKGLTYYSKVHDIDYIIDRIGGGDAFASGILHGILSGKKPDYTVNFATAYSSLKHSVSGDINPFSIEETERIMTHNAAVNR